MVNIFLEMLSYPFMRRALIVGVLVALCASLLGVSMVLKRYSMIGDGLSHVGFGSLAIATALHKAPLPISLVIVVITAFLLLRIKDNSKIKGDAAIAIISTGSLAFGVMAISLSTGMNTDVCNYLFGSILGVNQNELYLTIILSIFVIVIFILCYNRIFAVTFDETFAKVTGTKTDIFNMLIALLTSFTIVLGMRTMGALLISSLIIFPALTSMQLIKQFRLVVICSSILSLICFLTGLTISYLYATPTGATIAILNIIFFIIFSVIALIKGKVFQ